MPHRLHVGLLSLSVVLQSARGVEPLTVKAAIVSCKVVSESFSHTVVFYLITTLFENLCSGLVVFLGEHVSSHPCLARRNYRSVYSGLASHH